MRLNDLLTPALLLDAEILEQNLLAMQRRADGLGVSLRPHLKTHKCVAIARRQEALGARGVTVSTLYEAQRFADAGFTDITWAFPFPPVYAAPAAELARRITLRLVVDSLAAVDHLEEAGRHAGLRWHVLLKVDCGSHRAGVRPEDPIATTLARRIAQSPQCLFDGILTHAGHAYGATTTDEILTIARAERRVMTDFASHLRADGIETTVVSVGSTPTMTFVDDLTGVTEMRPGNYVFHDLTMVSLGVCTVADCAVTILASVVSVHGRTVLTDAGALALSKDLGAVHRAPGTGFGAIFEDYAAHRLYPPATAHVTAVSQEHGKVEISAPDLFHVGDRVRILEQHSCLAAAQFDRYALVRSDEVVDSWEILRGRS